MGQTCETVISRQVETAERDGKCWEKEQGNDIQRGSGQATNSSYEPT